MPHGPIRMKCLIINLPRATARREAMIRQLNNLHIEFELLDAIDGRNLTKHDWTLVDKKSRDLEGRRPLSQGMVGCHLSHRKALEIVASGHDELVAIFEDDISLKTECVTVFQALTELYSSGWEFDFVFLHRNRPDKVWVPLKRVDAGIRLGITKFSDWGTQGYVVSKKGASRLLERYPKIIHRTDHTFHAYWEHRLSVFSLETPVVFHGNEAGAHSFLEETAYLRPNRNLLMLGHRVASHCREEILKRIFFFRRVRNRSDFR